MAYTPIRIEPHMCVCGHRIEDHGDEPDLPCLYCPECDVFCEELTTPWIDIWDLKEKD